MSDVSKEKQHKKKKRILRELHHGNKAKETFSSTKDSISTVSTLDEFGQRGENAYPVVTLENTYQLGPHSHKRFPVSAVADILKDLLTSYLEQETYEVEWSRQMTKTLCEVIKAHVKELMIPRYKLVVQVHIGQLSGQGMQISSRSLWDETNDTFASWSLKNGSLFGQATVHGVYCE
ncbi:tctex1 domain-containing protein 1-A-like [Thalassophryne amazonica]|uniref:tctex1 domain-containing protein 1-A-like n=1 Tax=Thalassophryne amazonica TaxID=390379 RepID=UPI0014721C12|nr:tctex1 domain-containing protein 1-A-like [Thalassophryne amazonica]